MPDGISEQLKPACKYTFQQVNRTDLRRTHSPSLRRAQHEACLCAGFLTYPSGV